VPRLMFTRFTPIPVLLLAACSQSDSTEQDLQSLSSSAATMDRSLTVIRENWAGSTAWCSWSAKENEKEVEQ
jgi:hypothetical protein